MKISMHPLYSDTTSKEKGISFCSHVWGLFSVPQADASCLLLFNLPYSDSWIHFSALNIVK